MIFPNLTAEFEARSGCPLSTLAYFLNVTDEILNDVLYGDKRLTYVEFFTAYKMFNRNYEPCSGLNNYSMDYLLAPIVATLNPRKPKNRYRLHVLKERLSQALAEQKGRFHGYNEEVIHKAKMVIDRMSRGERVTYAECRNSINDLAVAIVIYQYQSKPPRRSRTLKEGDAEA